MAQALSPPAHFADLWTTDRALQNQAFQDLMAATSDVVPWAHEVWDDVVRNLAHRDNHNRAIAAQILCNLARSDPDQRILRDFLALYAVTRDERFVTARHCLQSLWKIAAASPEALSLVVDTLERRFRECLAEKNGTLIRHDIIQNLYRLHTRNLDPTLEDRALSLIESEDDLKYRKKYKSVWKSRKAERINLFPPFAAIAMTAIPERN